VAAQQRVARPDRRRALGGGRRFTLALADQLRRPIVWLRPSPPFPVRGDRFGRAARPAARLVGRVLPLLAAAGRDRRRLPAPGPHQRRALPRLLKTTPGLLGLVDTVAQRGHRPGDPGGPQQW